MSAKDNKRDLFVDAVKGIGIISIVIGHASWDIPLGSHVIHAGPFVYLYHLAVFAFCTGYLFKPDIPDIWSYIGKKAKGLYRPFLLYSLLYLLTRNLFIKIGIIAGTMSTPGDMLVSFSNTLTFNSPGELLGALWFVPMLFFASILYAAIWKVTERISGKGVRETVKVLCYMAFGVAGVYAMKHSMGLLCNLQVAYLFIPVIAAGHYFRRLSGKRILNPVGLILSFGILVYVVYSDLGIIELSRYMIINEWLFYPVTFVGIYFCLSLAKLLCRISVLERFLALAGQYSFAIMSLHLLGFKIVDYIVCRISGQMDMLNAYPRSFDSIWPVYYLVGVGFPMMIQYMINTMKNTKCNKQKLINKN